MTSPSRSVSRRDSRSPCRGIDAEAGKRRIPPPSSGRDGDPRSGGRGAGLAGFWVSLALLVAIASPVLRVGLVGQGTVAVLLAVAITSARSTTTQVAVPRALKLLALAGGCALFYQWRAESTSYYDLFNYVLLLPLAVVAGRRLSAEARQRVLRALVVVALGASVVALVEVQRRSHVFTGEQFFDTPDRDGQLRARAFFEQPLVLAVFVTLAALHVLVERRRRSPIFTALMLAILLAGVWASGSRSPLVVVACLVVVAIARRFIVRLVGGYSLGASALLLLIVLAIPLTIGALDSSANFVTSADSDFASAQYRAELYRQLFATLATHPLGFGIGPLPLGELLVNSSFGVLDVARTVDSEYVLAALKFGLPGLAVWVFIIAYSLRESLASEYARASAGLRVFTLSLFGAVLALSVWIPVVVLLGLLGGMCLRANADVMEGARE